MESVKWHKLWAINGSIGQKKTKLESLKNWRLTKMRIVSTLIRILMAGVCLMIIGCFFQEEGDMEEARCVPPGRVVKGKTAKNYRKGLSFGWEQPIFATGIALIP